MKPASSRNAEEATMSYNDLYLTISEQRRHDRTEAARIHRLVADRRAAARG